MGERKTAFDKNEPELTTQEIDTARDEGRSVLSFKARPASPSGESVGHLAVKFALSSGGVETILLDRLSAQALANLVQVLERIDWKLSALQPSETLQ